jgi:hypothetical protein
MRDRELFVLYGFDNVDPSCPPGWIEGGELDHNQEDESPDQVWVGREEVYQISANHPVRAFALVGVANGAAWMQITRVISTGVTRVRPSPAHWSRSAYAINRRVNSSGE